MWRRRQFDPDRVARLDVAGGKYDAHDAGLANQITVLVAPQNRSHQTGAVVIQLSARVPEAGDFNDGRITNVKSRAPWQCEQIDATCRDVLSNRPRSHPKPSCIELIEQLLVDQVDLPQIWLGRILGNARTVLNSHSEVGITLDA